MIERTRLPDWPARFHAFADAVRHRPFAWGTADCGPEFAGRAVEAITGIDLASQYRGAYNSAAEALAIVRRAGGDLADLVAQILPEYEHPSMARLGDIAAVPGDVAFGCSLGVVNGERILVLRGDGLGTVDFLQANRAFKVG